MIKVARVLAIAVLLSVGTAAGAGAVTNHAPIADDQLIVTDEDTAVGLLLTASDVDGDPLSYGVVTGPSHGLLLCTGPNCTYSPAPDFHGADSFTFRVDDGKGGTDSATVDLTVTQVNDNPVAQDSQITTSVNVPAEFGLSAVDVDGDTLTYAVVSGPAHGAVACQAGRCTYTPALDYQGPDELRFRVTDGVGGIAEGLVSFTTVRPQAPPFTATVNIDRPGPVTVGAGESILITGARISGPVTVHPGGSLTLVDAQISGGISATAPAFLSLCGARVAGPSTGAALSVSDATTVLVGDPAIGCAGNIFSGAVVLRGNGVVVFGANVVSSNVVVDDNGPGRTVVKANNVRGTLGCMGNSPAPVNAGQANTAGATTGQCAAL